MTISKKSMGLRNFPEGRIFISGLITMVLFFLWVCFSYLWIPGKVPAILAVTVAHVIAGRAAGIYLGLTIELDFYIIFLINIIVDTLWVLLLYPVVVFSMKHLLTFNIFEDSANKIIEEAERHHNTIKRYGPWGLFLFVLCPLPMTGPIVGGVIGNLIGLRTWINMGVVLSATYMALTIWAIILGGIHHKVQTQNPIVPIIILVLLIGIGFFGRLYYKQDKNH